jgi:hypothetical protein
MKTVDNDAAHALPGCVRDHSLSTDRYDVFIHVDRGIRLIHFAGIWDASLPAGEDSFLTDIDSFSHQDAVDAIAALHELIELAKIEALAKLGRAFSDSPVELPSGWVKPVDASKATGVSIRTLQRMASRGEILRRQIGRRTFYASVTCGPDTAPRPTPRATTSGE